jgi:hypothetical protein
MVASKELLDSISRSCTRASRLHYSVDHQFAAYTRTCRPIKCAKHSALKRKQTPGGRHRLWGAAVNRLFVVRPPAGCAPLGSSASRWSGAIGRAGFSPFPERCLHQALGVAIGFGRVSGGSNILETERPSRLQGRPKDRMLRVARGTYTVAGLVTPCRHIPGG